MCPNFESPTLINPPSAKIDGCILGKNTKVGAKAELTRCVTQAGYEVAAAGKHKDPQTIPLFTFILFRIRQE